jgi:hypothetical protein
LNGFKLSYGPQLRLIKYSETSLWNAKRSGGTPILLLSELLGLGVQALAWQDSKLYLAELRDAGFVINLYYFWLFRRSDLGAIKCFDWFQIKLWPPIALH